MNPSGLREPIAISVAFVVLVLGLYLVFEVGFRLGRWYQERTPGEQEGPAAALVGSLLALLAFLLAVTMGMAADRFDARRGLVLAEANAIGTTYLRAGYLSAPEGPESRALLREYVPLRLSTVSNEQLIANTQRAGEIQLELWSRAEALAIETPDSDLIGLYIESLNELIDLGEARVTAFTAGRVPDTIIWLLILGAALSMAMVGYSAGLTRRRSVLTAIVLVVALSAVLTLVLDLDRPREGFLQVSQQPLLDVQRQIEAIEAQ
jgi:hypothetical protein